jgi:histidine triad (HIT) family protein
MSDSIFTRIIKGEIPCHKVYEDDKTFAFMDIHPIQPGHVVIASKTPVETFLDLNQEDAAALWEAARKIAQKMKQVFPHKKRIGIVFEGLDIAHVHANIYPFDNHDEFTAKPNEPTSEELAEMAKKLAF